MKVHKPLVQYAGKVATHGAQVPVRGVWHDTEGHDAAGIRDLQGVVGFWSEQGRGYGAHLIIDKAGNSALCAPFTETVWAVENRNTGTVSVELIGFARFTPKVWFLRRTQLDKLAKWMAYLRSEYGIPLDFNIEKGWSGHADQSKAFGGDHFDPGKGFPKRFVLRRARFYYKNGWA